LKRPELSLAIEINKRVRGDDEWFDEPGAVTPRSQWLLGISTVSLAVSNEDQTGVKCVRTESL
jgi:hypothetical protein